MSTTGETLYHPVNGSTEQTWDGFSWPALFFGAIWLLVKGLWGHFVINLILLVVTAGFAAPIIWIAYGFIGNGAHKTSLVKKGYLTADQYKTRTSQASPSSMQPSSGQSGRPTDPISKLKDLAELREKGLLTEAEFNAQKAKLLEM